MCLFGLKFNLGLFDIEFLQKLLDFHSLLLGKKTSEVLALVFWPSGRLKPCIFWTFWALGSLGYQHFGLGWSQVLTFWAQAGAEPLQIPNLILVFLFCEWPNFNFLSIFSFFNVHASSGHQKFLNPQISKCQVLFYSIGTDHMNIAYNNNSKIKTLGISGGLLVSILGFEQTEAFPFLKFFGFRQAGFSKICFRQVGRWYEAQACHITKKTQK